jgi:hypothetical protein
MAQPYDLTVCGENKPFSLVSVEPAEGPGVITYTWYENGGTITGNEASICITEGRPAGTYAYVRKASSDACPGEVASNPYTVEVVATSAPTLTRSAETVCAGNAITFTATGGSGTYEWSCSGFTCSGDGSTQTTPTGAGSYSASVRSVLSLNGAACFSDPTPIVPTYVRPPGALGENSSPCGCVAGLNVVSGKCCYTQDCTGCIATCSALGMAAGVYLTSDGSQCRCETKSEDDRNVIRSNGWWSTCGWAMEEPVEGYSCSFSGSICYGMPKCQVQ